MVLVSGGGARAEAQRMGAAKELLCPPAGQAGAFMAAQAKAAKHKSGRPKVILMLVFRTSLLDQRSVPTCEEDRALESMQPKLMRTKDPEKKRCHPQTTQNSGYRTPRQGFIHLQHPEHLALFSKPAADLFSTLASSSFFFKKIFT